MAQVINLIVSVAANVIGFCICKWLDGRSGKR